MAQQRSVMLVDDLDGGKAAATVGFGVDGALYRKRNAAALRKALAEFVDHARRVRATKGGGSGRAGRGPVPRSGREPSVVREWAAAQGITGRIVIRIGALVLPFLGDLQPGIAAL